MMPLKRMLEQDRQNLGAGSSRCEMDARERRRWKFKEHAAAIYLQQGVNNEKFGTHPESQRALPAYLMVHNPWFFRVDLAASILLLSLALIEEPAVTTLWTSMIWIHTLLELLCLFIMSIELGVKAQWLGWGGFIRHRRTAVKCVLLVVMFIEACVVLIRQKSHFRITRSLRPLFLIDSHYSYQVRRFVRQIFLSLPAVLEMLVLLLIFMFLFSVLGYFFFSEIDDIYFQDPSQSFVSLFVLLTTANNPDVMMRAYAHSRWNASFFIIYTAIELYFIMNLLLAVVYDTFSENEKKKFFKLFLHRREAVEKAFKLLQEDVGQGLRIERVTGMLWFLDYHSSLRDRYLCFKAMKDDDSPRMSLQEFSKVYQAASFSWKRSDRAGSWWYKRMPNCCRSFSSGLYWFVKSRPFRFFFFAFEFLCGLWYFAETFLHEYDVNAFKVEYFWVSAGFVLGFSIEIIIKIMGLGIKEFFSSGWNLFDLSVTILSAVGIGLRKENSALHHLVVLRFLSLFELLRKKKSYRNIFNTVSILIPRFISAAIVVLVIYYFFAIVGMELFHQYTDQLKNCCENWNSSIKQNYVYNETTNTYGYYYLNSFENILVSSVTLWDLMVVNNWFIIMEGFTAVTKTDATRVFFMLYFIIMMVLLSIVVSFILEGFVFRIKCSRAQTEDESDKGYVARTIRASELEMDLLCAKGDSISEAEMTSVRNSIRLDEPVVEFEGIRWKDRFDFSMELYADEIKSMKESGWETLDVIEVPENNSSRELLIEHIDEDDGLSSD